MIPRLGRSPEEAQGYPLSILAWRVPWTVWSMGSQTVGHDWATCTSRCLLYGSVKTRDRTAAPGVDGGKEEENGHVAYVHCVTEGSGVLL